MRRTLSFTLSFLLLTLSFNAGMAYHYCGGELSDIKLMLFDREIGCGMNEERDCDETSGTSVDEVPCCEDEFMQAETEEFTVLGSSPETSHYTACIIFTQQEPVLQRGPEIFRPQYRPPPREEVSLSFIRVLRI